MTGARPGWTLAAPAVSRPELLAGMRAELASRKLDASTMVIEPSESRRFAERALQLRLSVLLRTYGGDYHTDSFDLPRLTAQVRRGDEAIWFWGAAAEIERTRAELRRPPNAPLPDLEIGTVTVLSAELEFGPGHGELCRSGSMDHSIGAVAVIMHRMIGYHSGADALMHERYHTLLLAARNRASGPSVRGGEAVQHIHCHYVQSRFWGIVPFYVMRGGVVECTELRESNRDPDDARRALAGPARWWFADSSDAAYATALCRLNFGLTPAFTVHEEPPVPSKPSKPSKPSGARARLLLPVPSLRSANHATVQPVTTTDPGLPSFAAAIEQAEESGVCCVAVHLRLDDPSQVGNQGWLAGRGYVLTAIFPPKRTWRILDGTRVPVSARVTGIWCRIRPGQPVVMPHYLHRTGADTAERTVLSQLRNRCKLLAAGRP